MSKSLLLSYARVSLVVWALCPAVQGARIACISTAEHLTAVCLEPSFELARRGHAVIILTEDVAEKRFNLSSYPGIEPLYAPDTTGPGQINDMIPIQKLCFDPATPPWIALPAISSYFSGTSRILIQTAKKAWENPKRRPDYILFDVITHAGADLAEYYQIPYAMVSFMNPITTSEFSGLMDARLSYTPISDVALQTSRYVGPLGRIAKTILAPLLSVGPMTLAYLGRNPVRKEELGLPAVSHFSYLPPVGDALVAPIFITKVRSLEGNFALPPRYHFVGPFTAFQEGAVEDATISSFLMSYDTVWVCALGRHMNVTKSEALILVRLFADLGRQGIAVIWGFRQMDLLSGVDLPASVLAQRFIPQAAMLQHDKVRAFITHGGSNSLNEAFQAGVPMLVLPGGGDHPLNAMFVTDEGAGVSLDKTRFSDAYVAGKVKEFQSNLERFRAKCKKIGKLLRSSGGEKELADFVELYLEVGHEHLATVLDTLPWVLRHDMDIYGFMLFILLTLIAICVRCRACCCPKSKLD